MKSNSQFPVRDIKFEEIAKCAIEDWDLPELKHPQLENVAMSFRSNIARVRGMMLIPTTIAWLTALTTRTHSIAEFEITGSVIRDVLSLPPDIRSKVEALGTTMVSAEIDKASAKSRTPEWDAFVTKLHFDASSSFKNYLGVPLGAFGFLDTLSTPITGTWTAIETLLGDLWEASLNYHPRTLALLKGKAERIAKLSKGLAQNQRSNRETQRESKNVPLDLIGMNDFDLRNCMGTVFRRQGRFEFTRLTNIREAYSQAFSENSGPIDSALRSPSLDCLNVLRNIIVHKALIADAEYLSHSKFLNIPKAEIGTPVHLDGKIVSDLIRQAISSTKRLSIAVDNWIAQN